MTWSSSFYRLLGVRLFGKDFFLLLFMIPVLFSVYCCGNSKQSLFSLQRFVHNLSNILWVQVALFREPQACGQAQVVSTGTGLICGLLLWSELEEMIGDFSDQSYSLNNKCTDIQMKLDIQRSWRKRFVSDLKAINWWNYARKFNCLPDYLNATVCYLWFPSSVLLPLHKSSYVKKFYKRKGKGS